MRLFFISDIHGNQFALEAILAKALAVKTDCIFCLGDISGYFSGINEVIQLLQSHQVISIKGNHDAFLTESLKIDKLSTYYPAYLKTKNIIGKKEYDWLSQLNDFEKIKLDGCLFEMYHGGKNDLLNEYVYPNLIYFEKYLNHTSNLFLFGHTHLQFDIHSQNKIFANPGSVGLPRNGDFRAHGLLYDTIENSITGYKVPYDLNKFYETYFGDTSVNKIYFHNINFGRSSNKPLINKNKLFLKNEFIQLLESNQIYTINSKIGLVLSYMNNKFLDDLLYVAAYADGSVAMTSNTLIFNWQIDLYERSMIDNINSDDIKKDKAGLFYYKLFLCVEEFIKNILNITMDAFAKIKKINDHA